MPRKRKTNDEAGKFTVESTIQFSYVPESNEAKFIVHRDGSPALTIFLNIDSSLAVIKRIIFENSEGDLTYQEFDANPEENGRLISKRVIANREILTDPQIQPIIDLWIAEAIPHVVRWLPQLLIDSQTLVENLAASIFINEQTKEGYKEGKYVIGGLAFELTKEQIVIKQKPTEVIIGEFLQKHKESIKNQLGLKGRGGSKAEYDLSQLAEHFKHTYPILNAAKKLYRRNKNLKGWQDLIKNNYPDIPDDLIKRLDNSPELDDALYEKLASKHHTSTAQDLALEYAARLCGAPSYRYTIRHLKDKLSQQGMSAKKVKSKNPD